jgi:hypothetical protein
MSILIDTAIGLILIYLAGALIVTTLLEVFAGFLGQRAKTLMEGLSNFIRDPDLRQEVLAHPLISTLAATGRQPSYIPTRNFSLAFLGCLMARAQSATGTATAVEEWITENKNSIDPIGEIARALDALRLEAKDDVDALRTAVEKWYDSVMERVSGLYKRWTQAVSIGIGLLVSGILNIDTIRLFRAFWTQPALRAAAADYAARITTNAAPPAGQQLISDIGAFGAPLGWGPGVDWSASGVSLMILG